jgi:hypothetical protein
LFGRALRLEGDAKQGTVDPSAQLADAIARCRGPFGEGVRAPERIDAPADPEQGVCELGLESEVELAQGHERDSALEQAQGGGVVGPELRAVAAGRQTPLRRRG